MLNKKYNLLEKYGLKFSRITEKDIELIRFWRNDPEIQQFMEYRNYISKEMQTNWFNKINNQYNYYFIVEVEERQIGLINIKEIDYQEKKGEPGFFIYDKRYRNSLVPYKAMILLNNFAFYDLELELLEIHILKSNTNAIKYNSSLGYKIYQNQENIINQRYYLAKEKYEYSLKNSKVLKYLLNTLKNTTSDSI